VGPVRHREGPDALKGFLAQVPFFSKGRRRYDDARLAVPALAAPDDREISTQAAFGKILDNLARGDSELAARIMTTSPDVTGTTSLGPWVNRRKLFARQFQEDVFKRENIPPPPSGSSRRKASTLSLALRK
jgi:pyruvate dehydrogenase E1 component